MVLSSGDKLGPYEILSPIGAGGMGEVYRAKDTKLDREVAVKVLAAALAQDPDRLARFEREAKVLASLNHPNIAHIYGIEERALVMELVEGETLAQRIAAGPMPLEEVLPLINQLVDALEYAHERGVIHRDLKPANIKVTPDDQVKVLDFGLAKALNNEPPAGNPASSPTLTMRATMAGVIMGTAAYMSPEQARGRSVDKRADIWAFGVVLFEMLTGRRLFEGTTISDTLAAVLKEEPDYNALPPSLRKLVRSCLAKDPRERLRDIGDTRLLMTDEPPAPSAASTRPSVFWRLLPWGAAVLVLAAAWFWKSRPDQKLLQMEISPPAGVKMGPPWFSQCVVSPDGATVVFVATQGRNRNMLWRRTLTEDAATPIAGTENGFAPFWSPDSQWIGFFAEGKLKKVAASGGQPQVIADSAGHLASWSSEDVILFDEYLGALKRVAASGGPVSTLMPLDASRSERRQIAPYFLPGGKSFLYASVGDETWGAMATLDGKGRLYMMRTGLSPLTYVPNGRGAGWLVYITGTQTGTQLVARAFDPASGKVTGDPTTIAESLPQGPTWSVSNNGVLVFRHERYAETQLNWVSREGRPLGVLGDQGQMSAPSISPDQKSVAFVRHLSTLESNIWAFDLTRKMATRLTFDPGAYADPVWSADGSRVIYAARTNNRRLLVDRPANGIGAETVSDALPTSTFPTSVSRDGKWLVVTVAGAGVARIRMISLPGFAKSIAFSDGHTIERDGSISPNGRWMLYSAMQNDRREVLVQSLPEEAGGFKGAQGKWQISSGGGSEPRWRADGKEILFLSPDGKMVSVPVDVGENSIRTSPQVALFQTELRENNSSLYGRQWDVSTDGKRFLIAQPTDTAESPITVILNWPKLLSRSN